MRQVKFDVPDMVHACPSHTLHVHSSLYVVCVCVCLCVVHDTLFN